jgi:hypothetical protein
MVACHRNLPLLLAAAVHGLAALRTAGVLAPCPDARGGARSGHVLDKPGPRQVQSLVYDRFDLCKGRFRMLRPPRL